MDMPNGHGPCRHLPSGRLRIEGNWISNSIHHLTFATHLLQPPAPTLSASFLIVNGCLYRCGFSDAVSSYPWSGHRAFNDNLYSAALRVVMFCPRGSSSIIQLHGVFSCGITLTRILNTYSTVLYIRCIAVRGMNSHWHYQKANLYGIQLPKAPKKKAAHNSPPL